MILIDDDDYEQYFPENTPFSYLLGFTCFLFGIIVVFGKHYII